MGCIKSKDQAAPKAAEPETAKREPEPAAKEAPKAEPKAAEAVQGRGSIKDVPPLKPGDPVTVSGNGRTEGTVVSCTTTDVCVKTKAGDKWFDIEDVQQFSSCPPLDKEVVVGKSVTTVGGLSGKVVRRTTTEVTLKTEDGEEKSFPIEDVVVLKVTIVSASNLRNADWVSKSDPYVVCQIEGREGKAKTHTVNDNLFPIWNFEALLLGFERDDSLKFEVYDSDFGKQDDFLGTVTLTSDKFEQRDFYGELPLTGKDAQGTLTLRARLDPGPEAAAAAGEPVEESPLTQLQRPEPEVTEVKQSSSGWCC